MTTLVMDEYYFTLVPIVLKYFKMAKLLSRAMDLKTTDTRMFRQLNRETCEKDVYFRLEE